MEKELQIRSTDNELEFKTNWKETHPSLIKKDLIPSFGSNTRLDAVGTRCNILGSNLPRGEKETHPTFGSNTRLDAIGTRCNKDVIPSFGSSTRLDAIGTRCNILASNLPRGGEDESNLRSLGTACYLVNSYDNRLRKTSIVTNQLQSVINCNLPRGNEIENIPRSLDATYFYNEKLQKKPTVITCNQRNSDRESLV